MEYKFKTGQRWKYFEDITELLQDGQLNNICNQLILKSKGKNTSSVQSFFTTDSMNVWKYLKNQDVPKEI